MTGTYELNMQCREFVSIVILLCLAELEGLDFGSVCRRVGGSVMIKSAQGNKLEVLQRP